jgi:hypothetical protein
MASMISHLTPYACFVGAREFLALFALNMEAPDWQHLSLNGRLYKRT